jgi:hypothetical protein
MDIGRAKEGEQDEETRWKVKLGRGREVRMEKGRAKEGEQYEERRRQDKLSRGREVRRAG